MERLLKTASSYLADPRSSSSSSSSSSPFAYRPFGEDEAGGAASSYLSSAALNSTAVPPV